MPLPKLQLKARALNRRIKIMRFVGEGMPLLNIAKEMGLNVRSVRRHLTEALKSECLFPNSLTPEAVSELRQCQAEVLANSRQKALDAQAVLTTRLGSPEEKSMDMTAAARLLEAVVKSVETEAALFGTKVPLRIQEESLRVNLTRVDSRVVVHLDRDQLKPRWPTPYGDRVRLTGEGAGADLTNGNSVADALDAPEAKDAPEADPDTLE